MSGRVRRSASVVVVGAGALGLACALELAKARVGRVLVVERHSAPGMGSTARANGGVRAQFSTPVNVAFSQYTIGELAALDEDSRGGVGLRRIGYLFMAGGAQAGALMRAYEVQRAQGVAVQRLDPDQVSTLVPFVRREGLVTATLCATDGLIDPHGVVTALWHAGTSLGVTYVFDTEVRGIEWSRHGALVRSEAADIDTEWVVNAAGPRAAAVAGFAGIDLPVVPRRRNLACTEPVIGLPASFPMCVDMDTGVLIRPEGKGVLIGYSETASAVTFDTAFEPGFLEDVAARAPNRFPFLAEATIDLRKCWAGLYPETPDHHAIVDAPRDAQWFIQCAGFGGHGIMHSLAAGRAVAELVRDQRCTTFDLTPLRLERFAGPGLVAETAVL